MIKRLPAWAAAHPIAAILLVTALTLAAAWIVPQIEISATDDGLMLPSGAERELYMDTRSKFGSESRALIFVEDEALFSPAKLASLAELVERLEAETLVAAVESLFSATDFPPASDLFEMPPLLSLPPKSQADALAVKARALAHPILPGTLISRDGQATVINLRLHLDENNQLDTLQAYGAIEAVIEDFGTQFERIFQHGRPYLVEQQIAYMKQDQSRLIPAAAAMIFAMLMLLLGRFKGAILPLITATASIVWTLAFMVLAGLPVTPLTFMVPVLILVIGSTEDVHLFAEFSHARRLGQARDQAVASMVNKVGLAVVFTAATTITGFLGYTFSDLKILSQFGASASFGLFANAVITLILIPALLKVLPDTPKENKPNTLRLKTESAILVLVRSALRRPWLSISLIALPLLAAGGWSLTKVRPDNNVIGFFHADSNIRTRANHLHERTSGIETFVLRLDATGERDFREPALMTFASEAQRILEAAEWVDITIGLPDYIAAIHQSLDGEGTLPTSRVATSEHLLFLHRSHVEPYATSDFKCMAIMVRHNLSSSAELSPALAALETKLEQITPSDVTASFTGERLLINSAITEIIRGQIIGVGIITLVATILMSFLFKSLRTGLLAIIPNLLPLGALFFTMAIAGIPLNTATCTAAAISIGLAVDDTIHLFKRYAFHRGQTAAQIAIDTTMCELIRPVVATTLALALGFLVLRFSNFVPIADFGLLSAVAIFTAVVTDLFVTPALILVSLPANQDSTKDKPHTDQ